MAVLACILFLDFRHTFSSPGINASDFSFIGIAIFVLWGLVTRPLFSVWTSWIVPLIPFLVCMWFAGEATRYLQSSIAQSDQGSKAILFFAGFFAVSLLWIILIPVEEAAYRAGTFRRGALKFWPLGFALAGLAMIALAVLFFAHRQEAFSRGFTEQDLIAARNTAIHLSFAFCGLALARVLLPIIRWKAVRNSTRLGPQTEGPHT